MTARDVRRVSRLLRCYPRSWRARYGDEFTELLLAELAERPRSWRRTADVVSSGLLARFTRAGLTSHELPPAEQIRAGLATLGCALAALMTFGVAMLAQLATGLQWASPRAGATAAGAAIMSVAAGCLVLIGIAAATPVAWRAIIAVLVNQDARLAGPVAVALTSAVILVAGSRHFQNGWPGTGGTAAQHGLVPAGLAAFGWASTLSVSSYWAHPALLGAFPRPEVAWMIVSPFAVIGLVAGVAIVMRRLILPPMLLRYQSFLASAASLAAVIFLVGAASWVLGPRPGQEGLFHPGLVDTLGLMAMAMALIVALRAALGMRHASQVLRQAD